MRSHARFAVPVPGAGGPALSQEKAREILAGLLRNVYCAFDYRDEARIYDTLDRSAQGDLLTQIYLDTRRSLELRNQGGARVKVKSVDLISTAAKALADRPGVEVVCVWQVAGSVGHWGHIHQRRNQYEAVLTIEPVDRQWKLTSLELTNEERL